MKIASFSKSNLKTKKCSWTKTPSYFQFYICCVNFIRISQLIKKTKKGSIHLKELKNSIKELKNSIKELKNSIKELKNSIKELKNSIKELKNSIKTLTHYMKIYCFNSKLWNEQIVKKITKWKNETKEKFDLFVNNVVLIKSTNKLR